MLVLDFLCVAFCFSIFPARLQERNAISDVAAVRFNFPFSRSTARAGSPSLPLQVSPHSGKARKPVLIHRQLHLRACLRGLGAHEKNIQDEQASVINPDALFLPGVEFFFKVAKLTRRQVIVENYIRNISIADECFNLIELTLSDKST